MNIDVTVSSQIKTKQWLVSISGGLELSKQTLYGTRHYPSIGAFFRAGHRAVESQSLLSPYLLQMTVPLKNNVITVDELLPKEITQKDTPMLKQSIEKAKRILLTFRHTDMWNITVSLHRFCEEFSQSKKREAKLKASKRLASRMSLKGTIREVGKLKPLKTVVKSYLYSYWLSG